MDFDTILKDLIDSTPEYIKIQVDFSFTTATRIDSILKEKGLDQKSFAKLMGKRESEISKWLSGGHNFTFLTLAKIESVLGEKILDIRPNLKEERKRNIAYKNQKTPVNFSLVSPFVLFDSDMSNHQSHVVNKLKKPLLNYSLGGTC